jgi:hypothetical protein
MMTKDEWMNEKFENSLDSIRGMMEYGKINYKTEENI